MEFLKKILMHNFEIFDITNSSKWSLLLRELPLNQQDIYFTPEYYTLYENLGDGKAQLFVFKRNNEIALYPFLINSVNELGYELDGEYFDIQGAYGYNGVISNSYDKLFIEAFYSSFNEYCMENNIIAEFTRFHPLINNKEFSKNHLQVIFDRKTVYVDLTKSYNLIRADYQRTTKKQIRRATERDGIKVEIIKEYDQIIKVLYSIYCESMNRVNATPDLYFNINYFKELLSYDNTVLFCAILDGKIISFISVIYSKNYINGHIGGTLDDYMEFSPFSYLYDEIIKYGKSINCKYYHFGGGRTSSKDDKLLKYKLNFSKNTADFYIGKKIHNQGVYNDVIMQWEQKYPEKIEKYKNMLLRYREI